MNYEKINAPNNNTIYGGATKMDETVDILVTNKLQQMKFNAKIIKSLGFASGLQNNKKENGK